MQDEVLMRGWCDGHDRFSADLDRCFHKLAGAVARLRRRRDARASHLRQRLGIGRTSG